MDITRFIKELRGSLPIPALQKFNETVEESSEPQQIIANLLETSPHCFEILSLLRQDNLTSNELATVFTTLSHILFNIAGELSQFRSTGNHITQKILQEYIIRLYQLVTPNSLNKNSRSVLQCLTGMIMVGSNSATDVLIMVDWKKMNLPHLLTRRETGVQRDVRAWCIYMLLAFLYSPQDIVLIKQFIQNKALLPSLFPGLKWDSYETVMNVLKVMKESIIYNQHITKTERVQLFTPDNTYPLLQLYRWIGPTGKSYNKSTGATHDDEIDEKTCTEQKEIRQKVHQLILTLCTSYSNGLFFKEKMVRVNETWSSNWAIFEIIRRLESPWQVNEGRDLIKRTLWQCPDLIKPYFFSIQEALRPREENNFKETIQLVVDFLEFQYPWKHLQQKGLKGVQVSLLPSALNEAFFKSVLWSFNERIRHSGMLLIYTVLSKAKQTLHHMREDLSLPEESYISIQRKLLLNLQTYLCGLDGIYHCWKKSSYEALENIKGSGSINVTRIEVLNLIIKVLILCKELYPTQIHEGVIHSLDMLHVVRKVTDNDELSQIDEESVEAKLQMKILCVEFLASCYSSSDTTADNLAIEETEGQLIEKSILYQLIIIYAQAKENFAKYHDNGREKANAFSVKCLDILSNILVHNGLTAHDEGNLSFWLYHLHGRSTQLPLFLTHIIQKTVSSLGQYTDLLVQLASANPHNSQDISISSFLVELEKIEVIDNEDISNLSAALPFSRLLLAAIELLGGNPNPECIQYFSQVVNDYLHSVNDPVFLANFLLEKQEILTPELKRYLRYWMQGKLSAKAKKQSFSPNSLTEILKHLLMSQDWPSVDKLLEIDNMKQLLKDCNTTVACQQVLAYLKKELNSDESKLVERFVHVLKCMSAIFEEEDVNKSKKLIATVLDDSFILANYQPFSQLQQCSVSTLIQDFITLVLSKYPDLGPLTSPYYKKLIKEIKKHLLLQDENIDFLKPTIPYISLEHILLSYTQVEDLFVLCLKYSCTNSVTLSNLLLEVLKLLLKVTSAKRKPKTQTVALMLTTFMEWCQQSDTISEEKKMIMPVLEKLLVKVLTTEDIQQLVSDDLKSLLQSDPIYTDLCCHIARLHPHHAHTFIKKMKKLKKLTPSQLILLSSLLDHEDDSSKAITVLSQNAETLKSWALIMDEDVEGYSKLFIHALDKDIFDTEDLVEICRTLYDMTVTQKEAPPQQCLSLVPAFEKLTADNRQHEGLPLDAHVMLIHIYFNSIRTLYKKKENSEELLKDKSEIINEVLPKTDASSLRNSLLDNKLWSSYVKQVLRHSLTDTSLGPCLLHTLSLLLGVLYTKSDKKTDFEESLSALTIYQMIFSHSHYLELMFNMDKDWEPLKEKLVTLQQTIVDYDVKVCEEKHVPILLGAYGASMSSLDQHLFKLLFTYEQNGYMKQIQPVLWGEAAISHFGVHSSETELWSDIKPKQVLALLDSNKILETCNKFDTFLPLEPQEIQSVDPNIYDIRFLLSLMNYLGNEKEINEIDYAECGAVAVGFAALSAHSKAIWGAGAILLKRLVEKMETSSHLSLRLPWLWLVGVVSCALNNRNLRVPPLTTQFLIRASALITQPGHPMYFHVMSYLFLKPAIDLKEVPELFRLYNSDNVRDHYLHRSFLLSMLSTGIRDIVDVIICQKKSVISLMMAMLQAPTVDTALRVQVLEVFDAMVKVKNTASYLVSRHNFLTILPLVVLTEAPQEKNSIDILKAVLEVLSNLWSSLLKSVNDKSQEQERKRKQEDDTEGMPAKIAKVEGDNVSTTNPELFDQEDVNLPEDIEEDEDETNLNNFEDNNFGHNKDQHSMEDNEEEGNVDGNEEQHYQEDNAGEDSLGDDTEKNTSAKLAPAIIVREFFNCLSILTPVVLSCDSPDIIAQHLETLTNNVKYITTIHQEMEANTKAPIRAASLTPKIIRNQINKQVSWIALLDRLKGRLTDEEEVKLLGSKAEDMKQKWLCEPLSKCHKKVSPTQEDDTDSSNEGYERLKCAVLSLLSAVEE